MALTGSQNGTMKLVALPATLSAAAAWAIALIWESDILLEAWQHDYLATEDIFGFAMVPIMIVVTLAAAWRNYPRSVSGVAMWSISSLALAAFWLTVMAAAPR